MTDFKVGCSPITSTIYAGTVSQKGLWGKKHDVTETAVAAVAQHLLQEEEEFRFEYHGKKYSLKVVALGSGKSDKKSE